MYKAIYYVASHVSLLQIGIFIAGILFSFYHFILGAFKVVTFI